MKRVYAVEIEFPEGVTAEDWKVHNLIATQIEKATIRVQRTGEIHKFKVSGVETIEVVEEKDPVTSAIDDFIGVLLSR